MNFDRFEQWYPTERTSRSTNIPWNELRCDRKIVPYSEPVSYNEPTQPTKNMNQFAFPITCWSHSEVHTEKMCK